MPSRNGRPVAVNGPNCGREHSNAQLSARGCRVGSCGDGIGTTTVDKCSETAHFIAKIALVPAGTNRGTRCAVVAQTPSVLTELLYTAHKYPKSV
jgi:hypothetical protein